jgi:Uma2 family endonuclease
LREYVLVSQSEALVELQRRNPSGSWEIIEARPGQILELASIGVGLDVAAIYLNPLGNPS